MSLDHVVKQAWRAFDRVAGQTWCVNPAVPILFFGDLDAYRASPLRVLTVGLNPSRREFPADQPFQRFPRTEGISGGELSRYLDAMSAYFRTDPYSAWFSAYEPLLNGMDASYYDKHASTALHTDICSPVATDPTWSGLDEADRAALESEGGPLWHMLLEELKPQIVALSVAKRHLERINFMPLSEWTGIDVFKRKANGEPRSEPYEIRGRWYDVGGEQSLFIFGRAAIKPFGLLDNNRKSTAGASVLKAYQKGRAKRCFVQFPHPGGEHKPDRNRHKEWHHLEKKHGRKFMQFPGKWIADDDSSHCGELWAWGEWEPESHLICKLEQPCDNRDYPRFLWHPYYVPKDNYGGLHNTDPFIFGERFLYSNCHQKEGSGLTRLSEGSVIAFGSYKRSGGERWWIDTVFVVANSEPYRVSEADRMLKDRTSDVFGIVTGGPLSDNREAGCGTDRLFRLYRGATPDDPVNGMFSFFPAYPAGGREGFPRPVIDLPSEHFNPACCRAPKGVSRERSRDQIRVIWKALIAQVRKVDLVLGTYAEMPPQRAHLGATNDMNTDGHRYL